MRRVPSGSPGGEGYPATASAEARAAVALSRIEGLGASTFRQLVDRLGSARAVLRAGVAGELDPEVRPGLRDRLRRVRPCSDAEIESSLAPDGRLLTYGGPGYPAALARLHDPPPVLRLSGPVELAEARCVAVVGTRSATEYGRRLARDVTWGLATAGWTVVSGLARGIDATAHQAALDAGGHTVGVLGCGLRHPYPVPRRDLYRAVAARGLLISEFDPDEAPVAAYFPRRNRIIAGLSEGVVVIQAGARSGSFITVDYGLDIGLEVFAVPGPVGLPASEGVHSLLRQGAHVATCPADVLAVLEGLSAGSAARRAGARARPRRPPVRARESRPADRAASPEGRHDRTAAALRARLRKGAAGVEEIARDLDLPIPQALAALSRLEVAGLIRALPGQRFELA